MPSRQLHRLIHSAARSSSSDHAAIHARLRLQITKRNVNVRGPLLLHDLVGFLHRRNFVRTFPAALSVATEIHSHYVNARSRKSPGKIVPNFPLAVALM